MVDVLLIRKKTDYAFVSVGYSVMLGIMYVVPIAMIIIGLLIFFNIHREGDATAIVGYLTLGYILYCELHCVMLVSSKCSAKKIEKHLVIVN